ncbi:UDP-N-acetylmuramoyl-L-alanyl-D-glutamate--2,6-diaminopimelate ligase [Desulfonema magnum]|uniref:UDP-N-acetylmuramoyl-L-alanyl-D-glutamate--2,6-diaminopimelate ligase n=1 Tax=Desulfonema magnum TaxID=45655 RepID=A0A975BRJ2_9BACT|nr:UDP-N-acetylmuramoyl-L-alanyl-D-glutamate--2,6-diaminopimelate ligase [Desulfonema magnum]QTA90376.1 UDP-N-acetylmuramoyl-L-alanyl-D-glutamate--2,6-diaminopimelate ligase [Desulfonema magnum]
MKRLSEFVSLLSPREVIRFQDVPVSGVACCPEELRNGALYCVIDEFLEYGHWVEGLNLLTSFRSEDASDPLSEILPERGGALVLERPIPDITLPQIIVPDARKAMAYAAKYFFDTPDKDINIIGVTGTNGKTTTTHLINQMLTACGEPSAALGTLGLYTGHKKYADTVYTTSLSPTLFGTLGELRDMDISTLSMEISSHALKLDRVSGLDTDVAVFTNLSRDHLDFHGTMADYRAAKMSLFTGLKSDATAVINSDDEMGKEMMSLCPCPVIDYGCTPGASLRADQILCSSRGTNFRVSYQDTTLDISTPLVGNFNVYNVLAAMAACLALGADTEQIRTACHTLNGVSGRVETVTLPGNRVGIVDYAHTPDSLEKILQTLRATGSERIITVFGCGGDRDRGKRPLMGKIASDLSDLCVVTSDNPRREDPDAIIDDILTGMPEHGVIVEPDRRKAIGKAFSMSRTGDVILVAGKGHEPYQIIGDKTFPFDDREELRCLNKQ